MARLVRAIGVAAMASLATQAQAFSFTLTPVTNTTPNFPGTIFITGTVIVDPGETFLHPSVMSASAPPFLANLTAGFNGPGNTWNPVFLGWNGQGNISGTIFNHVVTPGNFGYSGGMPVGLYASNFLGPNGQAGLVLHYIDALGVTRSASANYAINVVPAPGALALVGLAGIVAPRRRR
ncbi:MAG: hypothetical protein KDA05_04600 [Phycisphaerales bacterium]|nr:hypothetical protein [Phycisphaerales bacterium]